MLDAGCRMQACFVFLFLICYLPFTTFASVYYSGLVGLVIQIQTQVQFKSGSSSSSNSSSVQVQFKFNSSST